MINLSLVLHADRFYPPPPPPPKGPGSQEIESLTSKWSLLDSDVYPGAGTGALTADGRLDPWLAFAYDSVFILGAAVGRAKDEAGSATFEGLSMDRYGR